MHHTSIRYIRRLLVGIMILVFFAVLGNYLYSRFGRNHSETQDLEILGSEMLQSVESFEYSDSREGILRFKIRAVRLLEESPGKVFYLQEIEAFDFNPDESVRNKIRSRYAQYDSKNRTVDFIEDVRFFLGRDMELRTETLHYDMNTDIGTTKDPVQFYSDEINGKAVGLRYRLNKKLLELQSDVDFLLSPGKAPRDESSEVEEIKALSDKAVCFENGSRIEFQGNARLRSDSFFLKGDTIQAVVDEALKEITSLTSVGNASYRSETSDESRILRGDRMFFAVHAGSKSLEKIQVRGNSVFNSLAPFEERRLQGASIDLFFDPEKDTLQRINSRDGVRLRMKHGAEETLVSGERFGAVFNTETRGLKNIDVRDRARILMTGAPDSAGNEIRAERIGIGFRERSGQVLLERLRAQGSAQWTTLPAGQNGAAGASSSGRLNAAVIEMFYAEEGGFLDRINTSGDVVMTETAAIPEKTPHVRRISADRARFGFYPEDNKPKDMVAEGNVRVVYEGGSSPDNPEKPEKFRTASDSLKAEFAQDSDGIILASASQWGNFILEDESESATAGRCDYDAQNEKMILSDSPKIYFEAGYVTGHTAVYNLNQGVMQIRRNVRWILSDMQEPGSQGSALAGSRSIILADVMQYWSEESRAQCTGNVQLLSEDQQLRAEKLVFLDGGERIEAAGNVRHLIYRGRSSTAEGQDMKNPPATGSKDGGNFSRLPINIESSNFKYVKDNNTVTYSGNTSLTSSDLLLKSGTLETVLDDSGMEIERAIARDDVVVFKGKRKCKGDVAYYFRNPERFEVVGKPAESFDPEGVRSSAPRLTYNVADDRILLEGRGN
ncbi:MAG: LPS export ABC transporter periplasmic protein LptC [Acidobacteria bacterium]|nr:LPS export ABC transporter periplasmic protein LptC [Acidobacteriota bacterium]